MEFEANAFLPHQVRRTVGALVEVGRGKMGSEQFEALLHNARPATAGPAAPGHGLCLLNVSYTCMHFDGPSTDVVDMPQATRKGPLDIAATG